MLMCTPGKQTHKQHCCFPPFLCTYNNYLLKPTHTHANALCPPSIFTPVVIVFLLNCLVVKWHVLSPWLVSLSSVWQFYDRLQRRHPQPRLPRELPEQPGLQLESSTPYWLRSVVPLCLFFLFLLSSLFFILLLSLMFSLLLSSSLFCLLLFNAMLFYACFQHLK